MRAMRWRVSFNGNRMTTRNLTIRTLEIRDPLILGGCTTQSCSLKDFVVIQVAIASWTDLCLRWVSFSARADRETRASW